MATSLSDKNTVEPVSESSASPFGPKVWKRYSRNHELPLSVASSVFIHLLVCGLLAAILTGALVRFLRSPDAPVAFQPVELGSPENEAPSRDSISASFRENVEEKENRSPDVSSSTKTPVLKNPQSASPNLIPDNENERRGIDFPSGEREMEHLNQTLTQILRHGPPNSATPGPDAANKPHRPGTLTEERLARWTLIFNTYDGNDYLRQLRGLGATLAIPDPAGGYIVFRNLSERPPHGEHDDLGTMPGLHWLDTKPDSVRSLAVALGLPKIPEHIAAFFPPELEARLRNLEEERGGVIEGNIKETSFRVVKRGSRYDVVVFQMQQKR